MKNILFLSTLVFTITFYSCKSTSENKQENENSEEAIEQTSDAVSEAGSDATQNAEKPKKFIKNETVIFKGDKNIERYVPISEESYFKKDEETITVSIPITEGKLKFVEVYNVSSDSINAIVLILDGNNGNATKLSPITHTANAVISMNGIGMDASKLKDSIACFVVHDDGDLGSIEEKVAAYVKSKSEYDELEFARALGSMLYFKPQEAGGGILGIF